MDYNLFSFYDEKEPVRSFRHKEIDEWQSKVSIISTELDSKNKLLEIKDELIATLNKRAIDREDVIQLLKEKQTKK